MSIADQIFDSLKASLQLSERVTALAQETKTLAREVRDLDRRLIRVETALEFASGGHFASLPPADDASDDQGR